MSKTDPCLKCGQVGHTSSSCKLPTVQPAHTSEPYGDDGMVKCSGCNRRSRCASYVPGLANVPIHCSQYVGAR